MLLLGVILQFGRVPVKAAICALCLAYFHSTFICALCLAYLHIAAIHAYFYSAVEYQARPPRVRFARRTFTVQRGTRLGRHLCTLPGVLLKCSGVPDEPVTKTRCPTTYFPVNSAVKLMVVEKAQVCVDIRLKTQ